MRIVIAVSWLLLFAVLAEAIPPRLAKSESPWNVLVYGGKGEKHGAPMCHSLFYFSKSPLPFDFDDDFGGTDDADLITHANVTMLGAIGGQRIYEIKQTVMHKGEDGYTQQASMHPTMKILLVERRTDEFCDIYENQYTYDPTPETDEADILDIRGEKILKTYETDKGTWFLAYWAIKDHRPVRLKTDELYTAIRSVSPPGSIPFRAALNIKGSHFTADSFGTSPQQDILLGRIDLQLAVVHDKFVVINKAWISMRPQVASRVR